MIKGIVFDLDGTLIDSPLSLDQVRKDLSIPERKPILEHISQLSEEEQQRAEEVIRRHEVKAAEDAVLQSGVETVLRELVSRGIKRGIFTRNCKTATHRIIERLKLDVEKVITRDCAPAKPDPKGLVEIVRTWGLALDQVIYVGDYLFDLEVGKRAGMKTALFLPHSQPDYANQADYIFTHYSQFLEIVLN